MTNKMSDYQKDVYYVYKHVDPRNGELLYVGHGFKGRAWIHGSENTCLRSQTHTELLDEITDQGYLPTDWVQILERGLTKKSACLVEQALIRELKPRFNKPQGLQILKITPELFSRMKNLRAEGFSYKEIAESLGLSPMTVHRALNNQTKNVESWNVE